MSISISWGYLSIENMSLWMGYKYLLYKIKLWRRIFDLEPRYLVTLGKKTYFFAQNNFYVVTGGTVVNYRCPKNLTRPLNFEYSESLRMFVCGEYLSNSERHSISIWGVTIQGSFQRLYTFEEGSIRHLHCVKEYNGTLWFASGDNNGECLIGFIKGDFRCIVMNENQLSRTVRFHFYQGKILFATDIPDDVNAIILLDPNTGKYQKLADLRASIFSSRLEENELIMGESNEPSICNDRSYVSLWSYDLRSNALSFLESRKANKMSIYLHKFVGYAECRVYEQKRDGLPNESDMGIQWVNCHD